jgi:hypothetical protein
MPRWDYCPWRQSPDSPLRLYRQLRRRSVSTFHRPGLSFPLAAHGAAMLANGRFDPRVPAPSLHGARKKNWAEEPRRVQAPVRVIQQRAAPDAVGAARAAGRVRPAIVARTMIGNAARPASTMTEIRTGRGTRRDGGVSRVAKGADCKSERVATSIKTHSEKSRKSGPLPVKRLAVISECRAQRDEGAPERGA